MASLSFLTLCILCGVVAAQNPGFQIALTNKGLEYAREVALPILIQEISTLTLPDIHGSAGTPIGSISYDLTAIKVTSVNIPTSSIAVNTVGLAVSLSGVSIGLHANCDSGSCDVSASSVSAAVTVSIGVSATHEPTVATASCNANIGKLDVTFHGGASWLYNLFSGVIADALKSSLSGQLCSIIKSEIDVEGNKVLATLPVSEKIDQYSLINFELLRSPALPGDYIATCHKGEFFSITHPTEAPFTPAPIPLPAAGALTRMFYVWFSAYLLESLINQAGFVYEQAGVLNYTITPTMVPASFPLKLNTSSFRLLVPALYAKYPNLAMEVVAAASGSPLTVTIDASGMLVVATGTLAFAVVQPDKTVVPNVFVVAINVLADGTASVNGDGTHNSIVANLTLVNVSMTLASSTIGPVFLQPLQSALNIFTEFFLLPAINKQLNKGFVIPVVDGVTFVNPQVSYGPGYIVIDTDVAYKPAALSMETDAAPLV